MFLCNLNSDKTFANNSILENLISRLLLLLKFKKSITHLLVHFRKLNIFEFKIYLRALARLFAFLDLNLCKKLV